MSEGMMLEEAVPGGSQHSGHMEEAWQRLLTLEHEVRELRRLLLSDDAPGDARLARPALVPMPLDARATSATREADWRVTCLGSFQVFCGGLVPPPCSSRRGWGILQYLLVRPG